MDKSGSALSDGQTSSYRAVFIDTSLETHLALIVSDSDTVSDLKKKIKDEHPLCFPDIGMITIHALKVKRRGYFYHLSDSMFVRSAFHGVSSSWFLSVEASIVGEGGAKQHLGKPDAGEIVTHKLSADMVDIILYSPARKPSNIEDSSLPPFQEYQNAKLKPAADHNADNHCNVLSLETNNISAPGLHEKHDLHSKECEGPLRHTKHKDDGSRNVIGDAQIDVSLEGSSKNGSVVKERRKTKKRSEDQVHNHDLEGGNASAFASDKDASQQNNVIPDNSLLDEDRGKTGSHNMESGSKDIADEPCRISSSDVNKRLGSEIQTNEVLKEGTAVTGKLVEHEKCISDNAVLEDLCYSSLEDASTGPTVKKKRTAVRKDGNEHSSKDGRDFICDSTKATLDTGKNFQCSLGENQKGTNATLDNVSTNFLKYDHLLTASPSRGKKKRKRKSSKSVSQVVATVPSVIEHDRGQMSMDTEVVHKNLETEPDAVIVPGQSVQAAMASEPVSISVMEHPHIPEQEAEQNNKVTSSYDGDAVNTDAANVRNKSNSTEVAAVSAGERERVSEDHHAIATEVNCPLSSQEANKHNKDEITRNENVVVNDIQKAGNHQIPCVAEENELFNNDASNAMPNFVEANGNEEPGRSSKKRKKSKKSRDNVATSTEHISSIVGISAPHPQEPAHKDDSCDKSRNEESILDTDRETANVIPNVLESLQDVGKNSVDAESRDEKSRKKTKRKKNSAANNLPQLQTGDKDVSCEKAVPSVNEIMEVELEASAAEGNHLLSDQEANKHNKDGISGNENVLVNDVHKPGIHQIRYVAEEKELSKNNAWNAMPSAKYTISNGDEIDMNSKIVVTTDLVDADGNEEPRRASKKRKKSKNSRDNVATGTEQMSYLVGILSPHPHEPEHGDHSCDKSRKEGNEESKTTANTSILDTDRETAIVIRNVLESFPDVSKNSVDAESRDEKSRMKTKRKKNYAANNLPKLQTEDKGVSSKNATPSVNDMMEVEVETSAAEGNHPLSVQDANKHNKYGISGAENVLVNDVQKPGNHQIPCVAEEKELSKNNASNAMPLTISNRDEIDMNSKVVVTTDVVDANGNEEPGRSSKKRKKSKKCLDNVATGTEHTSSLVGISQLHPHGPAHIDNSCDKSRKEECILFPVVGNEESKTTANTYNSDTDRETSNVIRDVLDSLQGISKNSVDVESRDEKSRKKTKKKRNSAANNITELQTGDKDVSCKNATPSVNEIMEVEVEASSELTKKTKLVKMISKHQLDGANLEHENQVMIETNPEGDNKGKPTEALNKHFLKSGSANEANNHAEVSCHSDRTIANESFVPTQHKHDAAADEMPAEKVSKTKGAYNLVKAGNDKKMFDVHSNGPSLDLQSSLKLNENQGSGGEAEAFKSSTVEPERSLTKGNTDSSILQTKKKLPKVCQLDAKALQSIEPDIVDRKPEETTKANAFSASGIYTRLNKNKQTVTASSSSLESFRNLPPGSKKGKGHQSHVERRKTSRNNDDGEVVNSAKPNKSLLAKSGSIFNDDTDGSSDDEDSPDNSDSSTIAPSDNSLSSTYSDRDSTDRQNGLRKGSARSNIIKSNSSMKLDTIIRSSSRYKASKLTASQSQLQDTESQPVEFVPDSQASA